MASERTKGFLDSLGLQTSTPTEQIRGTGATGFFNMARATGGGPISQTLGGLGAGLVGLGSPGGRSVRGFAENLNKGAETVQDMYSADRLGISLQQLRARKVLREQLGNISVGSGSLTEQINAATEVARKAHAIGDFEVAMNAAALRTQLQTQLNDQKQAGLEIRQTEAEVAETEDTRDLGIKATRVGEEIDGTGKAVRIDGPRADELGLGREAVGQWLYIDPAGNRHVVDGSELVTQDTDFGAFGVGGIPSKKDNVPAIAAMNGATSGKINTLRAPLTDMGSQAAILTDVTGILNAMANPEFALDLTGKAVIQGVRFGKFADNAANLVSMADGDNPANLGDYEWNGEVIGGPAAQRSAFVGRAKEEGFLVSTLNRLRGEQGLDEGRTLADFLPQGIQERLQASGANAKRIARIAEQYWANVMELAYLDARLQEPSNRGLSDKDIENALRRIGAATANPASFAQRQLQLTQRMEAAVDSLGSLIQVPRGAVTAKSDVIDFIWSPEARSRVKDQLKVAEKGLMQLLEGGESTVEISPRVRTLLDKQANGTPITREDLKGLSPDELDALEGAL